MLDQPPLLADEPPLHAPRFLTAPTVSPCSESAGTRLKDIVLAVWHAAALHCPHALRL